MSAVAAGDIIFGRRRRCQAGAAPGRSAGGAKMLGADVIAVLPARAAAGADFAAFTSLISCSLLAVSARLGFGRSQPMMGASDRDTTPPTRERWRRRR